MISINLKSINFIKKNPNWGRDSKILDFLIDESIKIETFILENNGKSVDDLLLCKELLEVYQEIANTMVNKNDHKFKYEVLEFSLNQQVCESLDNLVQYLFEVFNDGGWSLSLCFNKLQPADRLIKKFKIDFEKQLFSKSYFEDVRERIVKGYIKSELNEISKFYNSDHEKELNSIKQIIKEYDLIEFFKELVNKVEDNNVELTILTNLKKGEGSIGRLSLESAWEIETYISNNPSITSIGHKDLNEVIESVIEMLVKYSQEESKEFNYYNFHESDSSGDYNFYESLQFYPNVKLFKDKNGLNNLKLYGKPVTEDLLEVLYSNTLTTSLKSTRINVYADSYHEQTDYSTLVKHMKSHFLRYLGYEKGWDFYTDFFKEKASRAVVLRCLQAGYNDSNELLNYNLACLELVDIVMAECPNLKLEDFCLTKDIVTKIRSEELTAKEAFADAATAEWFDSEIMSKTHIITPEEKQSTTKPLMHQTAKVIKPVVNDATLKAPPTDTLLNKLVNFFKN